MLRTKPHRTPSTEPTTSLVVQVRDWLAILAIVAGGMWAATEFFWDKVIAPRLESALVQISSSSNVVGRTDCCVLLEIETKLHNSGRRDAYIHASHFVVGAKKLDAVAKPDSKKISDFNEEFLERHLNLPVATGSVPLDALYGAAGPAGHEFLLLTAGNLVNPGSKITPGESIVRRMALIVPSELPFVSLRAVALVVHTAQASQGITWNWALTPKTLDLQVVPWRTLDLQKFRELRECGMDANDMRARSCREEAMSTGKELWAEFFKSDRYSYIQPHSVDVLAWKDHVSKK